MERLLIDMILDHQGACLLTCEPKYPTHALFSAILDLTSSYIKRIPFDPLVFAGYVKRNEPVVLAGLGRGADLRDKWTIKYLIEKLGDQQLSVAATPNGYVIHPCCLRRI